MIYLRPLNIKDANRLYEIKSNPLNFDISFTNFDTNNVTLNKTTDFLNNIINENNAIRLGICIKRDNILIGSITLGNINYNNYSCELHMYIDIEYQGLGYGEISLQCILKYIKYVLNFEIITLNVHKQHKKAIYLYRKVGFEISLIENDNNDFYNMYLKF